MPALNAALGNEALAEVTTAIRASVALDDMCVFIRYRERRRAIRADSPRLPAQPLDQRLDLRLNLGADA